MRSVGRLVAALLMVGVGAALLRSRRRGAGSVSIPVALDAVRAIDGVEMARVTYFVTNGGPDSAGLLRIVRGPRAYALDGLDVIYAPGALARTFRSAAAVARTFDALDAGEDGGPVAGLIAHEARAALGAEGLLLARLTLDIMRPVPIAPLQLAVRTILDRRRLKLVEVSVAADGVELIRSSAQFLAPSDIDHGLAVPGIPRLPGPEECAPAGSPAYGSYGATVEYRTVRDIPTPESGELGASWSRHSLPLFPDQPLTPALSAVITADMCFGSTVMTTGGLGYINSDFTAYFGREPRGEWIAFDATIRMTGEGTALGSVLLHDADGAFATVTGVGVAQEQLVGAG